MQRLGLASLVGLITLSACAQGSILTPLAANLITAKSYNGGSLDGNTAIGGSDLALAGSGFTGNVGQQLFAAVVDGSTNHLLTQQAGFTVIDGNGNFQMSWKNLVVPGQDLYVAYYADVNGNAFCNAIPTDNAWEVRLTTLNDGTVVAVSPDVVQRSVCDLFGVYALKVASGNAFAAHGYPGHNAYGAVIDLVDKSLVGDVQAVTVGASGDVSFNWPGLLVDHRRYVLAMCIDTTGTGMCDTAAEFTYQFGPVSSDISASAASLTLTPHTTFEGYWPKNISLPPAPAPAIPSLGGP